MVDRNIVNSWPYNDVYFRAGVMCVCEKTGNSENPGDVLFINLCGYTLRAFLREFPDFRVGRIVIITSKRLLPLAHFLQNRYPAVQAVFDSTESLNTIIEKLATPQAGPLPHKMQRGLNHKDYELLLNYLEYGNLESIQKTYFRSYSTVHSWKKKLAKKFMLRRLMDIIMRY